jgi:DnaJ homolog subfamily A member 2
VPDQEPGDLVFVLSEVEHETFTRAGSDLTAPLEITLAESLCGFSRVVLKHLDGRGIHISHPRGRILKPSQVLKVPGEGMPIKKSEAKGDLYLVVDVAFPDDGWLKGDDDATAAKLQGLLPKPRDPILAETVDEVEYEAGANLEEVSSCLKKDLCKGH